MGVIMDVFLIVALVSVVGFIFCTGGTIAKHTKGGSFACDKEDNLSDGKKEKQAQVNNDVFSQKGYSNPHNFKKPSADVLGEIFGAIVLTGAILCFFGALINAANAITGAEGGWFAAGVCLGVGIAMLFSYWMIKIFSKIYTTLVSIDSKLDDLNDEK